MQVLDGAEGGGLPCLWRASLTIEGAVMPDLLDTLEDEALTVSLLEVEDLETAEPVAWRIEMLFGERPDPAGLRRTIAEALGRRAAALPAIAIEPVAPEDWVAATTVRLPPIPVGRFVVHGAHARDALPPGLVPIEIEAGLAFGSGEHATTSSCLLALDRLARRHRFRRVLDVGCGSGVLAIAAAKCWPAEVIAVDNDPIAVRVAGENARLNGVARQVTTIHADGYSHPLVRRRRPFDLILANILADPLIELAPALRRHLAPGGHAVLSGLLDRQAPAVIAAHGALGLQLRARIDQGPWTALVLTAPRSARQRERRRGR